METRQATTIDVDYEWAGKGTAKTFRYEMTTGRVEKDKRACYNNKSN